MSTPAAGTDTRRYLRALPKAELHLHLEGSLRPALLLKLAERNRMRIPFAHADDFQRLYRYRDFRDFANALLFGVACLRTPQDFFDAVKDLGAMLAEQNVRYAEVTWTPQFYLARGLSLDDVLAAMNDARRQLEATDSLVMRWIPDLVRSRPNPAAAVVAWATSQRACDGGVVALGLGGPEEGHPAAAFEPWFSLARKAGLAANPHAGEGDGPASVRAALNVLGARRIGHGVRAIEDASLVADLARSRAALEVCLTSNVRLGVFPSLQMHPVKRLLDAGCAVTLNTDDPVLFGTSLAEEYEKAMSSCGLGLADIRNAILCAVDSSYLAAPEKAALRARFEGELAALHEGP